MAITHKDISLLTQKATIAGTEKIPVSDTEYVTTNQIASLAGTVTSVGMTVPSGLSVSGSPITSSGTLAVTLDSGRIIPRTHAVQEGYNLLHVDGFYEESTDYAYALPYSDYAADDAQGSQRAIVLASTTQIPTALSALSDDSTHRLVTDTEKSTWNGKQNAITVSSSEPTSSQGSDGDIWIVI